MGSGSSMRLSDGRFAVEYHLVGTDAQARANADLICIDQTVEAPSELIAEGFIRDQIVGRVESFGLVRPDCYEAVISFPPELLGDDCAQLLNVMFGITSLKRGVRVTRLHVPDGALRAWPGARFGRIGLRERVQVHDRPLVCGVLKPLGLPTKVLADLAYCFALGGLDLIKDDQGLVDHAFCPFEERIARCTDAVAKANRETGRACVYLPHVTGRWEAMQARCLFAKQAGAGGVLICPGLAGFDAIRDMARDNAVNLPILSHPALLGSYIVHPDGGIAPAVIFGQLPRLAGADGTLYPTYGGAYAMDVEDCRRIAAVTGEPWGQMKPIFPTAAGRMGLERVSEMCAFYGNEVIFILGSHIQRQPEGLVHACERFVREVTRCARG